LGRKITGSIFTRFLSDRFQLWNINRERP